MTAVAATSLIRKDHNFADVNFNIKTDFGAVGDGIADDSIPFGHCLDAVSVLTNKVQVAYPGGKYYNPNFPYLYPFDTATHNWVRNITAQAAGAELTFPTQLYIGGAGNSSIVGFFHTNSIGDSTVSLTVAGYSSNFSVGDYVFICGLALQGNSYPVNMWVQEWKNITAIDGIANTLTFDSPLQHVYKETWPNFFISGPDITCGAAAVFLSSPVNDATFVLNGFQFDCTNQIYSGVKNAIFYNCTTPGQGFIPTNNKNWLANGCNFTNPATIFEVDKSVELARFINCNFAGSIINQSGNEQIDIYGTTLTDLFGTAKNMVIENCKINDIRTGLSFGGFGFSENVTVKNSSFEFLDWSSPHEHLLDWSFSGGVFSRANTAGPLAWGVPNAKLFLNTNGTPMVYPPVFRITDVTQDGTNLYIHTTLTSIPVFNVGATGLPQPADFCPLGCDNLTVINCTGLAGTVWSLPQAQGKKPGEYYNATFTGDVQQINGACFGWLNSFKINVIKPYTGINATCLVDCNGPSSSGGSPVCDHSNNFSLYKNIVDAKIAGLRTITPSGVSGVQATDLIISPGDVWWLGETGIYFEIDISGESAAVRPIINIEIILTQEP